MKNFLQKLFAAIIRPFYGSGIGHYFPFTIIGSIYRWTTKDIHIIKKNKDGFLMKLNGELYIDSMILMNGFWERHVTDIIKKYLKKGDIFLDIGANIGYISLFASPIVGDTGKVLSFEPSSKNLEKFKENISLNHYQNINIYPFGVSSSECYIDLFYDSFNPGGSSMIKTISSSTNSEEKVKVVVLDEILDGSKIDFIKMDIEGYEISAFEGMKQIITLNHPKIIFEFSPKLYSVLYTDSGLEKSKELLSGFVSMGYNLYEILPNGKMDKIINILSFIDEVYSRKSGQSDIFCLPK